MEVRKVEFESSIISPFSFGYPIHGSLLLVSLIICTPHLQVASLSLIPSLHTRWPLIGSHLGSYKFVYVSAIIYKILIVLISSLMCIGLGVG